MNAGFLSGFSGLESVPGPQLPEIDFLKKWNGTVLCNLYDFVFKLVFTLFLLNFSVGSIFDEDLLLLR